MGGSNAGLLGSVHGERLCNCEASLSPQRVINRSQQLGLYNLPGYMTSPMLYADKLTPRKSIISTQRPCPWPHSWCWCCSPNLAGAPADTEATRPDCHPTKPRHSRDCVLASSSLATQGPRGTQTERWKEGCQFREVVGGDFSRSPCLCKNFKLSSCHPQHLQGQPRGWKWGIQSGREAVVQFLPLSHPTVPRCSHLLHLFWVW